MVEFEVKCKECGEGLTTYLETSRRYPYPTELNVQPCSKCLAAALEEGRLAGIEEGER
jgi:hypothetical protein